MQQLGPHDAKFIYMETPNTPLQIGWLNIYDPATAAGGAVRFKAILSHIEQRLHTVRFFRQRLLRVPADLDHPYWVDDQDFDLEYHIRHVALPAPGDWRQLCILTSRLFARPFDFARPLWEFYVIEGLGNVAGFPPNSFAVLSKIHHAAIDGGSGVEVTTFLHTPEADTPPPAPHPWQPEPIPNMAELLARGYLTQVAHPVGLVKTLAKAVVGTKRVRARLDSGELRNPGRHKVPRTRFSGSIGPHRVVEGRRFPLSTVKGIRALVPGSTINDALLAIVGGAMRRYLLDKQELPEGTMTTICPISIRTEEQQGQLGNQIANMIVTLATDVADPVERLRCIHEGSVNAKGFTDAVGARTLAEVSQVLPGSIMGLGIRMYSDLGLADRVAAAANTTVTNVPGPQQPLYLAGAKLVSQFGLGPPLEGLGIFHVVLSYCGEITVMFVADRDKLPDPGEYARCIDEAYAELAAAVPAPPAAMPRRRAAPKRPSTPRRRAG